VNTEEWNHESTPHCDSVQLLRVFGVHIIRTADSKLIFKGIDGNGNTVTPSTPAGETTLSGSAVLASTSYASAAGGSPHAGREGQPASGRGGAVHNAFSGEAEVTSNQTVNERC
jgi:hypothetical protein